MARSNLTDDQLTEMVNQVFKLFRDRWPRRFSSIWKTKEAIGFSKKQWLVDFRDRGITEQQLMIGLDRVRFSAWPPDNPAAFMDLCNFTPEDRGAPSFDAAWKEATRNSYPLIDWQRWSHRCVYWGAIRTGVGDIHDRGEKMRAEFDREYQRALDEADELTEPPTGNLPKRTSRERREYNEKVAIETIEKLRSDFEFLQGR